MNINIQDQKNIYPKEGSPSEHSPKLQSSLQAKLGEALIVLGTKIKYGKSSRRMAFEQPQIEIEVIQI